MKILAIIVGILFLILAFVYFTTPANSLPSFLPGYDLTLTKIHKTHAAGAFILGLLSFAFAWFHGGKKSPTQEN